MKKKRVALLCAVLLLFGLTACQGKEVPPDLPDDEIGDTIKPFDYKGLFGQEVPTGALAAVIKKPSDQQLNSLLKLDVLTYQADGELFLIVPLQESTSISICEMAWDDDILLPAETLTEASYQEGFGLQLWAERPEEFPLLRIVIQGVAQSGTYDILQKETDDAGVEFIFNGTPEQIKRPNPFSYEEVADFFQMTEQEIIALYGEGEKQEGELVGGFPSAVLSYPGATFDLWYPGTQGGRICKADISDDKIPAPRGISVGDTMEYVLAQFRDDGKREIRAREDGSGHSYALLYGTYENMEPYGLLEYEADVPVAITYVQEDILITFELENGLVSQICYIAQIL